jgi:adenine-specific DNA-methyltransferase
MSKSCSIRIFGENQFVNEIIWKRQSSHSDAKQGSKHLGRLHDAILLYAKGAGYAFNHLYQPYSDEYIEDFYRYTEPETGRRYRLGDVTAPGGGAPSKGNPHYEFLGVRRYWRYNKENMDKLYREGPDCSNKARHCSTVQAIPRRRKGRSTRFGVG